MTPRRLAVDWPACKAHGLCAELLPEIVQLDEWGYPVVAPGPVPEELAQWFPTTVEVDLREGGEMRFTFPAGEMEPMGGRVVELDPPRVFAFLWGEELLRLSMDLATGTAGVLLLALGAALHDEPVGLPFLAPPAGAGRDDDLVLTTCEGR